MAQPNFRVVDSEKVHPRDAARIAVKRFRTNAEREKLGVCNQSTGAANLFVDETLRRTERVVEEQVIKPRYRVNPYLALVIAFLSMAGVVWLVMEMW